MYTEAEAYLVTQELMTCNTICEQDEINLEEVEMLKKYNMFEENEWEPFYTPKKTSDDGDFESILKGYYKVEA